MRRILPYGETFKIMDMCCFLTEEEEWTKSLLIQKRKLKEI